MIRRRRFLVFVVVLALGAPLSMVITPAEEPATARAPIPADAKKRANPYADNAESREIGKTLFEVQCAMCHGKTGDGTGDLAATLKLSVPKLGDPARDPKLTDGEYFWIVSEGCGTHMKGEKARMAEETRWHLVSYLRALARQR